MGEIKKQSINNSVLSYLGAGLGFLIIYIQPHLISSTDIGLVRLMYSFGWMAAIIMPLGMGSVAMRFFPKIKNPQNGHNGFFSLLIIISTIGACIIGFLLYSNKSFFINYYNKSPEFPPYFNVTIVFAYILSLISVLTVYSSVLLKTTVTVFLTDVFIRLGQLGLVIIYHYELIERHWFILGYAGLFLLQLLILIGYLFYINAVSFKINWAFYKTLNLKEIYFFAGLMMLTAFASIGIKYLDQLLIGHYLNESMLGIYATSVMMCAIMEIPFNSLERIAQPKIAYAWNINDVKEVSKIYEMSSRYMFFAGGLLFCLLWASLDFIFEFLPAEYQVGKAAFCIVSVSSLLNLLTGVNSSVILSSHKYFAASFFLFVLMAVSFVANNVLIKSNGISGAAYATLIAIGSFNLLKYVYILIRFKMQPFTRHTVYILVCIALSLGIIFMLPQAMYPFIKAVIGSAVVTLIFSLMNLKFNTIEEVNKVFKRFRIIK